MYSGNMPEDSDSDLLALFVLDNIPNEVRMLQITEHEEFNTYTTIR